MKVLVLKFRLLLEYRILHIHRRVLDIKGKDFNFYVGATAPFNLSVKKSLCEEKEK